MDYWGKKEIGCGKKMLLSFSNSEQSASELQLREPFFRHNKKFYSSIG